MGNGEQQEKGSADKNLLILIIKYFTVPCSLFPVPFYVISIFIQYLKLAVNVKLL